MQAEKNVPAMHSSPALKYMGYAITYLPEKYLPYWPFEPFLPLFVIAPGVYLTVRVRAT